ncbi:hypothetical protein M569_03869 [Genlisea aurea]|uniref:Uncharacterized protein n=1 Tax=Genlisea aurea TaxID=192259 RepID=S8D0R3_9LAMI|nr:hypothetical protein M569_03869 [Genlisea aurea]
MAWRGSFSRSFVSNARAAGFRSPSSSSAARFRHSPLMSSARRRLSFSNPRFFDIAGLGTLGELGGAFSLMPPCVSGRMSSYSAVNLRAFCELCHGSLVVAL